MGIEIRQRSTEEPLFYRISAHTSRKGKQGGDSMARFETTDIFKGAFLLSNGGNLSGISFNDRQAVTFTLSGKNL